VLLILAGLVGGGAWLWRQCAHNPAIPFLSRHAGAEWIVYPSPPDINARMQMSFVADFRRTFSLARVPRGAELRVRGFRRVWVLVNGEAVSLHGEASGWKSARAADVTSLLRAGGNTITASVDNSDGPPALWLRLDIDGQIVLRSDESWSVSLAGATEMPARPASAPQDLWRTSKGTAAALRPSAVGESLRRALPALLALAAISVALVGGATLLLRRRERRRATDGERRGPPPFLFPIRHVVLLLWAALLFNNCFLLYDTAGFDAAEHLEYMEQAWELPLADDGWEMYQPPLYYLLAGLAGAPAFRLVSLAIAVVHLLLLFHGLRLIFPEHPRRQAAGFFIAAFLPAHLYLSHYPTNEGLAAMLATASLCACLRILTLPEDAPFGRQVRGHLLLGATLGLAMLAKFSALVLIAVILAVLAGRLVIRRRFALHAWLGTIGVVVVACIAVCGWHFGRVWLHFGHPFVGNWDPATGFAWWQDPGYHTVEYYLRFGRVFFAPYYSSFHGFFDSLYSTLWGDGLLGGGDMQLRPPWNYDLMAVGYWLAAAPMAMILAGIGAMLARLLRRPRPADFLLAGAAFGVGFAVFFMTLRIPSYAQAKAFYGLSVLLPLAAFAGWGFDLLAGRSRRLSYVLCCLLAFWALTSWGSYWIRRAASETHFALGLAAIEKDRGKVGAHFDRAAELGLDEADAYFAHGILSVSDDDAIGRLHKSLALDPRHAGRGVHLARLLIKKGQYAEALVQIDKALQADPDHGTAHAIRGDLRLRKGDALGAVESYREALRVSPALRPVHHRLARIYTRLGQEDRARAHEKHAKGVETARRYRLGP